MKEDSLFKRYLIKLISTIAVAVLNICIQIIIPRALSVSEFADYTYNLNVFTAVISIAILSADGAFASKISKRREEIQLIKFYGKFGMIVIAALNIFVTFIHFSGLWQEIFENQLFVVVLLALNASVMIKMLQEMISLFDCYVMTRYSEPLAIIQKCLLAAGVYAAYALNLLKLHTFYLIQIVTLVIICVLMLIIFRFKNINRIDYEKNTSTHKYLQEFYVFCRPLVVANVVTNALLIFSNWLLRRYGGETEQAYYGVAWQLNSLIAYTFTPIIALLQREYAVRVHATEELRDLYRKILKVTIIMVSFFACFVIVNADYTLRTFFGEKYVLAVQVTQMIMVYTLFQAWGQANGAMYSATERTKIYARIAIFNQVFSFFIILLFQIPNPIWSNGLGALGVGLQKTITNIVGVVLCGYFNCKYLKLKFYEELLIPLVSVCSCLAIGYGSRIIIGIIFKAFDLSVDERLLFFINGVVYTVLVGIVLYKLANIVGLEKGVKKVKSMLGVKEKDDK